MNVKFKVNSLQETLKKERKKVAFLVALAAVFLYVWIPLMKRSPHQAAAKPGSTVAAARATRTTSSSKPAKNAARNTSAILKESTTREPAEYPAFLKIPLPARMVPGNPFVSLCSRNKERPPKSTVRKEPKTSPVKGIRAAEKEKIGGMILSSIMRLGKTPCCVIDGEVLGVGSLHKGLKIKEIGDQAVILSGKGDDYRISVKE